MSLAQPILEEAPSAQGWRVTWTSLKSSGAEGPFTDLAWAIARVKDHAWKGRTVIISPMIEIEQVWHIPLRPA